MYLSWIKTDHTTGKYSVYSTGAVRELMVTVLKVSLKKKNNPEKRVKILGNF